MPDSRALPGHIFVPHLKWSSYWGTWNRVLASSFKPWHDGIRETTDWVEVNVSPVNGWTAFDAAKQVANIHIRRHGTSIGKKDCFVNQLRLSHYEELLKCAGEVNANLILFGNLLPTIDWKKFYQVNNGGADYQDIRRQ